MSYTVLARRYRSASFDEVIGQDLVTRTLKRAIETGRIAHAFLFCGTRGVGKTTIARLLAKALNCTSSQGPTPSPCGTCPSCVGITSGQAMDVVEIDAASHTGVDNVREIIENATYKPASSRFKIYVIDEAHMLSKSAFNALLKTMEEPPPHAKFILATTEAEKIPATIRSRCQRYDFSNVAPAIVAGHLANICRKESIEADPKALLMVARAGAGSVRDSLSLLDRLLSTGVLPLTAQVVEETLGLPQGDLIAGIVDAIGTGDVAGALGNCDRAIRSGLTPEGITEGILRYMHEVMVVSACGADSEIVKQNALPSDQLLRHAKLLSPAVLAQDMAILDEVLRQMKYSTLVRALLDATIVRLASAAQFTSVADLLRGLEQPSPGPRQTPPSPSPVPVVARPPREEPPAVAPVAREPLKASEAPRAAAPAARQQQLTMADLESMRDNSETVRAVLDNMGVGQAWVIPSSPKPN